MSVVRRAAGGRVAFVVVLLLVLVVGTYLFVGPPSDTTPLDPRSTTPTGTKGLVLLLEAQGADVELSDEVPGVADAGELDVALVLEDLLDDDQRQALLAFADAGGRVVVADPLSPMTPLTTGVPDLLGDGTVERGTCTIGALEDLGRLDVPGGVAYEVEDDPAVTSCFGDAQEAFVVAREVGSGTFVALAGAGVLVNQQLDQADNAPLATTLLAPSAGTTVRIVDPPGLGGGGVPGGGDPEAADELVDPAVWRALAQLAVAFLFFAAWRAVRLGRPVAEPQPVQVEGSELVAAVGRLLQQNRNPQAAAALLQHDLRRTLEERLGVPSSAPPEVAVEMVVARTGMTAELVARALAPIQVQDDADLVEVARSIESIRAEVLHGQRP